MIYKYDVIVVGAGHAGCEAASAAAHLGSKTLLITMDMNKIGQMSCNPAVGGIAKGQIVREIDAMGGVMGIVTDKSAIQFRMLNSSKGPAMWSPRSQSDRKRFIEEWIRQLSRTDNLYIWQDVVSSLIITHNRIEGVRTVLGIEFMAGAVVLTSGTFLNGLLHFGKTRMAGGRISESASYGITEQLKALGIKTGRMKTGTPCRIDARSIHFDEMTEQKGDNDFHHFSYLPTIQRELKQMSCWITYTNPDTHNILRTHLADSPLFNGQIKSIGPRYCPSIETKIVTFAEKEAHQLFIEPEGVDSNEYYVNGFSSSLPWDVQFQALRTVRGLEDVVMYRPGYAIEYDFFDPTQLTHSLETKQISHLFFAGQINGTTGYEEAAGQGIIAGINAHIACGGGDAFTLSRDEAYIGVLIDDLINKGVDEPYRMFTSRAEYRILLRQDNADSRLTEKAYKTGLVDKHRIESYRNKNQHIIDLTEFIKNLSVSPTEVNDYLINQESQPIHQKCKVAELLARPSISLIGLSSVLHILRQAIENISAQKEEVVESTEISIKYKGYIERERLSAEKVKRLDEVKIPENYDYQHITSLSTEARQKLNKIRPATIGDAARIPGVSPNDISVLLILMGR